MAFLLLECIYYLPQPGNNVEGIKKVEKHFLQSLKLDIRDIGICKNYVILNSNDPKYVIESLISEGSLVGITLNYSCQNELVESIKDMLVQVFDQDDDMIDDAIFKLQESLNLSCDYSTEYVISLVNKLVCASLIS